MGRNSKTRTWTRLCFLANKFLISWISSEIHTSHTLQFSIPLCAFLWDLNLKTERKKNAKTHHFPFRQMSLNQCSFQDLQISTVDTSKIEVSESWPLGLNFHGLISWIFHRTSRWPQISTHHDASPARSLGRDRSTSERWEFHAAAVLRTSFKKKDETVALGYLLSIRLDNDTMVYG